MNETEIKVGDIFVARWGYVDKIVDFFKVIKKTKHTVVIKMLESKVVKRIKEEGYAVQQMVVPSNKFQECSTEKRKVIQDDGSLKITSFYSATKWTGEPVKEILGYY